MSPTGVKYKQTRCLDFPYGEKPVDENYYDMYWKQAGACYPWHVIWNKIYRAELWENNLDLFQMMDVHGTMLEDFIFSSVVLSDAHTFTASTKSEYFYVQSSQSSTSQEAAFYKWEKILPIWGKRF